MKSHLSIVAPFAVTFAALAACTMLTPTNAWAADTLDGKTMIVETGCKSKYSDGKRDNIWRERYELRQVVAQGIVDSVKGDQVGIRLQKDTLTADIMVRMRDKAAAYDLEKGNIIKLQFTVDSQGGCFLPFYGSDAVILKEIKKP